MQKVYNKIADNLYIIIIAVFVGMILMYIPIADRLGYYMTIVLLPCGALLALLSYRHKWVVCIKKRRDCWIYIAFCISYAITIIVNSDSNLTQNLKALVWLIVYFFLLYMWQEKNSKKYFKKVLIINRVYIVVSFILIMIGMIMLVWDKSYSTQFDGIPIGVVSGRLFGFFKEINSGCILIVCSITASITNYFLEKILQKNARKWHALYGVNGIFGYIFLIAAKSRTAIIGFSVAFAILICAYIYKFTYHKEIKKKIIIYTIVGISAMSIMYGFSKACEYGMEKAIYQIRKVRYQGKAWGEAELSFERKDESASVKARADIWKQSIELWRETNMVWGIGSGNMKINATQSPNTEKYTRLKSGEYGEATHNMFISLLLYSGISGSTIMVLLWSNAYIKCFSAFLMGDRLKNSTVRGLLAGEISIVTALLLYGIMFTAIVFSNIFETAFFWWHFGVLSKLLNEENALNILGDCEYDS